MDRAGPQPSRQRKAGGAVVDEQRQVLVLPVIAVVAAQSLLPMHGIVAGIGVENDLRGRRAARADKQLHQVIIEDLDPLALRRPLLQ